MSISKFNREGYSDPTAYDALSNIEKEEKRRPFLPLVYICSLYAGDTQRNMEAEFDRASAKGMVIKFLCDKEDGNA